MKIYFERTGGFMGQVVSTVVDTDQLPPEEALSLIEKLDESDFFCLPASMDTGAKGGSGADRFCYKVTVEAAGAEHTVEASEEDVPDELYPLLNELTQMARAGD